MLNKHVTDQRSSEAGLSEVDIKGQVSATFTDKSSEAVKTIMILLQQTNIHSWHYGGLVTLITTCIWRVSVVDQSYIKWLTTQSSTDTFYSLSLTSRRLLVTSFWSRLLLHQYDVTDRQLLRVVDLSKHMKHVYHMAGLWSVTKAHCRTSGSTHWVNCLAFVTAELR